MPWCVRIHTLRYALGYSMYNLGLHYERHRSSVGGLWRDHSSCSKRDLPARSMVDFGYTSRGVCVSVFTQLPLVLSCNRSQFWSVPRDRRKSCCSCGRCGAASETNSAASPNDCQLSCFKGNKLRRCKPNSASNSTTALSRVDTGIKSPNFSSKTKAQARV